MKRQVVSPVAAYAGLSSLRTESNPVTRRDNHNFVNGILWVPRSTMAGE